MNDHIASIEGIERELKEFEKATKHIDELIYYCKENQANILEEMNTLKLDLEDQLKRLEKKIFEIAVVGLEKAGKSSLLNAWIGFDLLPSDESRCTYTTTEIRSCGEGEDQKYVIDYFTSLEFDKQDFKKNLNETEQRELEKHSKEIASFLNKETKTVLFKDFEIVKNELRAAICHPGQACAVKKVCIYTNLGIENIVLYDVPGYNSPFSMHKEHTKLKIASADAILYAKRFEDPSLVDSEVEIFKICDESNSFIKAKDKLIVALTKIDKAGSPQQYSRLYNRNIKEWKDNEIESWRLVPICSIVELKLDNPETKRAASNLKQNNGGATGFKELKEAVNKCVKECRTDKCIERCKGLSNKIRDVYMKVFSSIKKNYDVDENTQIEKSLNQDIMEKIYKEWWSGKWKQIEIEFQEFFQTEIRPKSDPDTPNFLSKEDMDFKELYNEIIDTTFKKIDSTKREHQEKLYRSCNDDDGVLDTSKGNIRIRTDLAQEFINSLDKINDRLNNFLLVKINLMIEWMRRKLWQIPEIRTEIMGKDSDIETSLFKKSFEALIQRLARPATNIFVKNPRTKIVRIRVMEEYQMELLTLDTFIIDGQLRKKGIIQFLANGKHGEFLIDIKYFNKTMNSNENLNVREQTKQLKEEYDDEEYEKEDELEEKETETQEKINNNTSMNTKPIRIENSQFNKLEFAQQPETFEEVHREISEDVNEFLECMKNSIFYGSGIIRFYNSELDKFKRKFIELEQNKGRWRYYVENYIKNPNPKVNIPAPSIDDEIRERENMVNNIRAIINIYKELDGKRDEKENENTNEAI